MSQRIEPIGKSQDQGVYPNDECLIRQPYERRCLSISRFFGLGLVWVLLSWNASGAMVMVPFQFGNGDTIEEAEADLRSQFEAMVKFGSPIPKNREEILARCNGGGYSAHASYHSKVNNSRDGFGYFAVCGHPSWESAMSTVKANCMREFAKIPQQLRYSDSECTSEIVYHDRLQAKERGFFSWFDRPKKPEPPKPEPKPQVTIGTRSYDGRYAPDCTKIGLALDIHGDNMTLSENGRVLFTQQGKLLHDYWGRTPPPGGEAGFSGKHHGDPAFELMRQGGVLFGNINPSKQMGAMAGRTLQGYRYCGLTCNAGKAEVSGGNVVCRR